MAACSKIFLERLCLPLGWEWTEIMDHLASVPLRRAKQFHAKLGLDLPPPFAEYLEAIAQSAPGIALLLFHPADVQDHPGPLPLVTEIGLNQIAALRRRAKSSMGIQ
jgi:hypothetical protein